MFFITSSILLLAIFGGCLKTAVADPFGRTCDSPALSCILTGPGITVTANFEGGVTNTGVNKSSGLTAWETAPNGPKGTIKGCGGTATWEFQEMGQEYYDATRSGGSGHLQAWFGSAAGTKVTNGGLTSQVEGDDLYVVCS